MDGEPNPVAEALVRPLFALPAWLAGLINAVPDWVIAGTFLVTWVRPSALGEDMVDRREPDAGGADLTGRRSPRSEGPRGGLGVGGARLRLHGDGHDAAPDAPARAHPEGRVLPPPHRKRSLGRPAVAGPGVRHPLLPHHRNHRSLPGEEGRRALAVAGCCHSAHRHLARHCCPVRLNDTPTMSLCCVSPAAFRGVAAPSRDLTPPNLSTRAERANRLE